MKQIKILILSFSLILININLYAQIPNSGFENWEFCTPKTDLPITYDIELFHKNLYLDSIVVDTCVFRYYKYFTPNGDEINDEYRISGKNIKSNKVKISDHCSNILFESTNIYDTWNGDNNAQGIYYIDFEITFTNGKTAIKHDSIQIIHYYQNVGGTISLDGWGLFYNSDTKTLVTPDSSHFPNSVGKYSIKVSNNKVVNSYTDQGIAITSASSSKKFNGISPSYKIVGHPNNLTGYYKYFPDNIDTLFIGIYLFKNLKMVASGVLFSNQLVDQWTEFNIPISSYVEADSGAIILSPCYTLHGSSTLFVDNLNFDKLITGTGEIITEKSVVIFPNPSNGKFVVNSSESINAPLLLFDLVGKQVYYKQILGSKENVDVSTLPKGMYLLKILEIDKTLEQKIIIE